MTETKNLELDLDGHHGRVVHPLWVLGAADPEMVEIEKLLRNAKQSVIYAFDRHGARVSNNTAYRAQRPSQLIRQPTLNVVTVECGWESPKNVGTRYRRPFQITDRYYGHWVDVIRSIDLGREFMVISSLGKVIRYLAERNLISAEWPVYRNPSKVEPNGLVFYDSISRWVVRTSPAEVARIPRELVLVAAGDMCLPLAYKGQCLGVEPKLLQDHRLAHRAHYRSIPVEELRATLERTMNVISTLVVDGLADLTVFTDGTLPEAPEAAARLGVAILCRLRDGRSRKERLVRLGTGPAEDFRAWMEAQEKLGRETYGNPEQGYAGCYL